MPRSGTSCVSHALQLAGVEFGSRLYPGSEKNEKGYWEHPVLVQLNEHVLLRSGGSFESPPANLRWGWRDRWRAKRILREFSGSRVAGFKDPRLTFTYPLWKPLLPPHRLVVCFRHPDSVSRSLAGMGKEKAEWGRQRRLEMWRRYNERLLGYADGAAPVHWCDFDEAPESVEDLVRQIAETLPLSDSNPAVNYDERLHHHREPGEEWKRVPGVEEVYRRMLALSASAGYKNGSSAAPSPASST